MLDRNGDKLVGEWKSTQGDDIINCEKNETINHGYMCAFGGFQASVTWDFGKLSWNYHNVSGELAFNKITWSDGTMWAKQIGTTTSPRK